MFDPLKLMYTGVSYSTIIDLFSQTELLFKTKTSKTFGKRKKVMPDDFGKNFMVI